MHGIDSAKSHGSVHSSSTECMTIVINSRLTSSDKMHFSKKRSPVQFLQVTTLPPELSVSASN